MSDFNDIGALQPDVLESIRTAVATHIPLAPGQVFPTVPGMDTVWRLVARCRKNTPDATDAEIVHFIHEQGDFAKRHGIADPLTHIFETVPDCFVGDALSSHRARQRIAAERTEKREQARRDAKPTWVCPTCNVYVSNPGKSDKGGRICPQGHPVEQRTGFLAGALTMPVVVSMVLILARLLYHIWTPLGQIIWGAALLGLITMPFRSFIKGLEYQNRIAPKGELASGAYGQALGLLLTAVLFVTSCVQTSSAVEAAHVQLVQPQTTSFLQVFGQATGQAVFNLEWTPGKPYYTDSGWERVFRFFVPRWPASNGVG